MLDDLKRVAGFLAEHPLTRDRQLAAWYRFVRWQVQSRTKQEVIVPWVGDLRLVAQRGMTGATGNIYAGLHEFPDMTLVCHLLRANDVFVDAGANIGSYSLLAAGISGARVIAFEPDPDTASRFWRNIVVNGLEATVTLHEVALGEHEGVVSFTVGMDSLNHVAENEDASTRQVRQTSLDAAVASSCPLMMKVDVEGFEDHVVRGAKAVLANSTLKAITLETVNEEVAAVLAEHGFEHRYYDPFSRRLSRKPSYPSFNSLFVRDAGFVEHRLSSAQPLKVLGRSI